MSTISCPACSHSLSERKVGDVKVDICEGGCGGAWFDEFELKRFDEPHEFPGNQILSASKKAGVQVDHNVPRDCPKCSEDAYLIKRWYDIEREVEVDQCAKCSGIWLDVGELASIRSQFESESDRQKAFDLHVQPYLDKAVQSVEETTEKMREKNKEYVEADTLPERLMMLLKEIIVGDLG